jgi:hypothetical protein
MDDKRCRSFVDVLWTLCFVAFIFWVDVYFFMVDVCWLHRGVMYLMRSANRMDARQTIARGTTSGAVHSAC